MVPVERASSLRDPSAQRKPRSTLSRPPAAPSTSTTCSCCGRQLLDRGAYARAPRRHKRLRGLERCRCSRAELQEVSSDGHLLWDWRSQDHISLAETGRWWPFVIKNGSTNGYYDLVHWNSIEPDGKSVIASFRHLDAVYRIRKSNGAIAWKLGGTTTPQSLEVRGDPESYTFGGQHDARVLADGTLSVFDNRTGLGPQAPGGALRDRPDGRHSDASSVDQRSRHPRLVLLRFGSPPSRSGLVDRLGSGEPPGDGLDRRLRTRWSADLPPDFRFHVQLPGTASPRGPALGAGSAPRYERDVLCWVPLGDTQRASPSHRRSCDVAAVEGEDAERGIDILNVIGTSQLT